MTGNFTRLMRAAGAAMVALAAACGPTEYEPAASPADTGYRTTQLAPDRYLVSFEGNAATPRETVETYLLFRAAEVASRSGHPYFAVVEQETERDVDVHTHYTRPGFHGFGPPLGFARHYGFPYYATFGYGAVPRVSTTESYEAFATVRMFDERPAGRQDILATPEVLASLRPRIEFGEG